MSKRRYTPKEILYSTLKYAFLFILVLVFIVPILTVFFAAFKTGEEYGATSVLTLPSSFLNFDNFIQAVNDGNMINGFKNTVIILVFSLI